MGVRLSENELQKSLDFCVNLFNPTLPGDHDRVARSGLVAKALLDVASPLVSPTVFESALRVERLPATKFHSDDSDGESADSEADQVAETKLVLDKINARRVVHSEYSINNLEVEYLDGFAVVLKRGKLGLRRQACV